MRKSSVYNFTHIRMNFIKASNLVKLVSVLGVVKELRRVDFKPKRKLSRNFILQFPFDDDEKYTRAFPRFVSRLAQTFLFSSFCCCYNLFPLLCIFGSKQKKTLEAFLI